MSAGLYACYGKRLLDVAATVLLLCLAWPVLALAAIAIWLESPGPVLFRQERLGQHGRLFRICKFRTMTHRLRTVHQEIKGREAEVTRVGFWLRRLKIDELPQLLNVLTGEMALIGPRPPLPSQIDDYDAVTRTRLNVRPGLTGLAQINGGVYLSWPERWEYDVQYVERLSLTFDLWILWRTLAVVLAGEEKFLKRPSPTLSRPDDTA